MTSILTDEEAYVNRNSKENHDQKLQDFKTCHDKVREQAMCALKLFELKIEADQAKQRADDAQRILAVKTAKAQHEIRLREAENAAKLVPKPPPRVPTPPPQSLPQVPVQRPAPTPTPPTDHTIAAPSVVSPQPPTQLAKPRQPQQQVQQPQPVQPPQQPPKQPQQPPPQSVQHPILNANQPQPAQTSTRPPRPVQDPPFGQHTISTVPPPLVEELSKRDNVDPSIAALEAIHKTCKDMRKYIKSQPRDFVKHAGDMRRKIKMHMGQLVEVGSNKHQVNLNAD
jgi:nucleoporin GLE1